MADINALILAYREAEAELKAANDASEQARLDSMVAAARATATWEAASLARDELLDAIRAEQSA